MAFVLGRCQTGEIQASNERNIELHVPGLDEVLRRVGPEMNHDEKHLSAFTFTLVTTLHLLYLISSSREHIAGEF